MKFKMLLAIAAALSMGASPAISQSKVPGRVFAASPAAAADTTDSNLAEKPLQKGNVETFDVLGLKLGMSPRETSRIAQEKMIKGFYDKPSLMDTFEAKAVKKANSTLTTRLPVPTGQTILSDRGVTSDGGGIEVIFMQTREGPKLYNISYNTLTQGQTRDQLREAVIAKYGKPDWDMGYQMFWCGGKPRCSGVGDDADRFKVYMDERSIYFSLYRGDNYNRNAAKAIDDRAAELSGKASKPVAF